LWGDRFKGVIVSKGEAQLACSAYIDLNPVRAAIVQKPEDYRWSSLGLRVKTPARAKKLLRPLSILPGFVDGADAEGVEGVDVEVMENTVEPLLTPLILSEKSFDHYFSYREFVYKSGGVERSGSAHICPDLVNDVLKYHGDFGVGDRFRYRIKNFSEGIALGNYSLIAHLQKIWNRKYIRPRSFMGKDSGTNWSFTTRILRL
jgi:hypothetical protein